MKVPFLDLKSQYAVIKNEIDTVMSEVISQAAFVGGPYVKAFEDAFAKFCGVKHCIGVGNGTDALYVALRSLGVGPGHEVITAANSFIATSEAITQTGARVVFVDTDPNTYNIDANRIEEKITAKTKAIVPVHLFGQPADMERISGIAARHCLQVVEDAAQAHGAEISGTRTGSFGHLACFSFYPGKNLGAYGDGGAIVTNDEVHALRCRQIANHGRTRKYDHEFEGVNSRLDGLQAGILSVKLNHLTEWTKRRREISDIYREFLDNSGASLPVEMPGVRHVYHLFVVRVKNRDAVQMHLKERGIETGVHYPIALPNLAAYKYLGHKPDDFPVANLYSQQILSLPIYPELSPSQIAYVCHNLIAA
jgi:dTDP-4-amino-4,6-dideoxygalactose transaminase